MTKDYTGETYHLRMFYEILYDSITNLYLSYDIHEKKGNPDYYFTYIRSSILSSILLLECGANCCIDSLKLPKKFSDDIDRLAFISKYEFYLNKINSKNKFNRGCKEIQEISEIKSIRDHYVHPKVKKGIWSKVKENQWIIDFGNSKLLHVPISPRDWRLADAVKISKSINDFFNMYFLKLCEFDSNTVCELLLSGEEASIPSNSLTHIDTEGALDKAVLNWKIDFKYLGK